MPDRSASPSAGPRLERLDPLALGSRRLDVQRVVRSLPMLKQFLKFRPMEAALLRAIANPRRCAILWLVWERELSAGDIAAQFDVSWPAISQSLGVLRRAGAVTERRAGRRRYYRADRVLLRPLADAIQAMWAADLETLRILAEADQRAPAVAP